MDMDQNFDVLKLTDDKWTEDDLGLGEDGDVGGDIQIGTSFSRRFAMRLVDTDDGVPQFAVLDFYTYVASDSGNTWVQTMVQYARCADPNDVGGSETHLDIRYWDGLGQGLTTDEQARELCANLTQEDLSEAVNQMA